MPYKFRSWSPWGSSLALAVLLFFLAAFPLAAQQQTENATSSSSSEPLSLTQQIANLQNKERLLVQRLTERNKQVTELTNEIVQARQSSAASADSSETLQKRLDEAKAERDASREELRVTSSSLEKLQETQMRSEKASKDYQEEAQSQIAEARGERDTWKAVAIVSWIATAAAAVVAALR